MLIIILAIFSPSANHSARRYERPLMPVTLQYCSTSSQLPSTLPEAHGHAWIGGIIESAASWRSLPSSRAASALHGNIGSRARRRRHGTPHRVGAPGGASAQYRDTGGAGGDRAAHRARRHGACLHVVELAYLRLD